ncbi:MAG: hypothetical protein O3A51_10215, partial [Verrucomicrobia bacterium]|nr:hypothetical protein [Verrucomicrobiota bacterium]
GVASAALKSGCLRGSITIMVPLAALMALMAGTPGFVGDLPSVAIAKRVMARSENHCRQRHLTEDVVMRGVFMSANKKYLTVDLVWQSPAGRQSGLNMELATPQGGPIPEQLLAGRWRRNRWIDPFFVSHQIYALAGLPLDTHLAIRVVGGGAPAGLSSLQIPIPDAIRRRAARTRMDHAESAPASR